MFTGLFRMRETCPHCGLKFEREPGYFLGSIYINYGLTALITTIGWVSLRYAFGYQAAWAPFGFALFCVVFPTFFFRYARALWLAMDCRFESAPFFEVRSRNPGETDGRE